MHYISGTLNAYFPFELKRRRGVRRISEMYDSVRNWQIKDIKCKKRPRTDLMDKLCYRNQIEQTLVYGQRMMNGVHEDGCGPYATHQIASAFRQSREDNFFVKEASVIVSKFDYVCSGVNDDKMPFVGTLYYFNNFGNKVGTYLLALKFENLSIDEFLLLKHTLYKRALAEITEWCIKDINALCRCMSFQSYVCQKSSPQSYRRKNDIDFRARYTFTEVTDTDLCDLELYGLLTANEKCPYAKIEKGELKDYSNDETYSLYLNLCSALIVNRIPHTLTVSRQKSLWSKLNVDKDDIPIEILEQDETIAGLGKGKFPPFLKAVETHMLTNNIQRYETVRHRKSFVKPIILAQRRYHLWRILHNLEKNHCFINEYMFQSFGISTYLIRHQNEFILLTNHVVSYIILIVSAITLAVSWFNH